MAATVTSVVCSTVLGFAGLVAWNIIKQLYFPDSHKPPVVFHWLPIIGSTVYYGVDPYKFFAECRAKYGDCFTFYLLGSPTTVYLGSKGNEFILNGKLKDLNAEEVYGPLTTPVFGKGIIYDCPNAKLMDQKRLLGPGLSGSALKHYVPMFVKEVEDFIKSSSVFEPETGICDISSVMAEITTYTAAGSLQGKEIRDKLDTEVSLLYRHLDDAFVPVNFVMPWLPIPRNIRRDRAQQKMAKLYLDVLQQRRKRGPPVNDEEEDMLDILMKSPYRDGNPIPDHEIANLMIALLMGGQHNTSSTGSWIVLRLAHDPALIEELYREQLEVLGPSLPPLTYDHLQSLDLHNKVIKETLRLHAPIHSVLRKVKTPMPVSGTNWVIPPSHTLLAAPGFLGRTEENFPDPEKWDPHRWDNPNAGNTSITSKDGDDKETVDYGFGAVSLKSIKSPYLPFGGGRHRCVAEKYAYTQLGAILATLVRLLQWEQVDMTKEVPPTDYSSMFSRPMHPAEIRWKHRR
ncbi:hypothetical protein ABW20_dc0106505 [Dactylellina cionopaga]|nr:hypothetical protein ABW20_dc0106505 [Dactylellina cionopaga]